MTTGGRRGELCALRWEDVDLERGTAALTGFKGGGHKRRVALDEESVQVLVEQFERYTSRIEALGLEPDPLAYVFSPLPDHSEPLNAPSVSQRYKRMVSKLGIDTHLHNLRHYSATELIGAGVDVRTVAGRLGHADATTTLKIYAAWLSEFDQRAAKHMSTRMPERPTAPGSADFGVCKRKDRRSVAHCDRRRRICSRQAIPSNQGNRRRTSRFSRHRAPRRRTSQIMGLHRHSARRTCHRHHAR